MVWYGMVWFGTVWCGVVSCRVVSYRAVSCHDMIWQGIPEFGNFMNWNWCLTMWIHLYPDQPSTTAVHSITNLWDFGSNNDNNNNLYFYSALIQMSLKRYTTRYTTCTKKNKIQQKYTLAYYKVTHFKSHLPVCQTKQMCLNFLLEGVNWFAWPYIFGQRIPNFRCIITKSPFTKFSSDLWGFE